MDNATQGLRELSLFSGAGGGLLGTRLLGWEPIGYVEWDDYCQRVIAARIKDGMLPDAPIFGNIKTFNREGFASAYSGLVDVITAGFPCTPFSTAGKQKGADDERNMWPATIQCIRQVRPRYCFFENVPALLNSGYFGTIANDLAQSGYTVRWRCLSAAELGAPHKRDRLWICAYAQSERTRGLPVRPWGQVETSTDANGVGKRVVVANTTNKRTERGPWEPSDDTEIIGYRGLDRQGGDSNGRGRDVCDTPGKRLPDGQYETMGGSSQGHSQLQLKRPTWWEVEP